jgi:hypothetical protein
MSTSIVGNKSHVKDICVNSDCKKEDSMLIDKASLQDIRCLRFKKGESSFGGKLIDRCPKCDSTYSPEDILKIL